MERFTTLRQELGNEFADARVKMEAMSTEFATSEALLKELLQEASKPQIAMKIEAAQSLSDSEMRGEALKDLISQSSDIQARQATQVRDVVEGLHLSTRDRFNSIEASSRLQRLRCTRSATRWFTMTRGLQPDRRGVSPRRVSESRGVCGLLHEKDIRMPMIPYLFDQLETPRLWWKDVAEYCERWQEYTDCGLV